MEDLLFSAPVPEETPDGQTVPGSNTLRYASPDRACYICKQRAWEWNPATNAYECHGDLAAHDAYNTWHQETFPWLHRDSLSA